METQQILNETQQMVKVGSKWLKALYEAHLEKNHITSKPKRCYDGLQGVKCKKDEDCGEKGTVC